MITFTKKNAKVDPTKAKISAKKLMPVKTTPDIIGTTNKPTISVAHLSLLDSDIMWIKSCTSKRPSVILYISITVLYQVCEEMYF